MKKLTLLLLLMVSTNVFAEWTLIDNNEVTGTTAYVDFKTIRKKGNKVKIWTLIDFDMEQTLSDGRRYMSTTGRYEYDCVNETALLWEGGGQSGKMMNGKSVWGDIYRTPYKASITPESYQEIFFKIACGKK